MYEEPLSAGLVPPYWSSFDPGGLSWGSVSGCSSCSTNQRNSGIHEGFKVVPGKVKAFDRNMGLKIPHMGWNQVYYRKETPIFRGIENGSFFYFVHSYYVDRRMKPTSLRKPIMG